MNTNLPEIPKLEDLGNDVYKTLEALFELTVTNAYDKKPIYPKEPNRPFTNKPDNYLEYSKLLEDHAKKIHDYYIELSEFKDFEKKASDHNKKIYALVKEYIKKVSGLESIPEKKRKKVWEMAIEKKDEYGYYHVYNHIVELVDLIKVDDNE